MNGIAVGSSALLLAAILTVSRFHGLQSDTSPTVASERLLISQLAEPCGRVGR
jgi:hypothetical protein